MMQPLRHSLRPRAEHAGVACALAVLALSGWVGVPIARATSPGPGWAVSSLSQPTNFSNAENAGCEAKPAVLCDEYLVTVTNVGERRTDGSPVVIHDQLPVGIIAYEAAGKDMETGQALTCKPELPPEREEPREPEETPEEKEERTEGKVSCTDEGVVLPGDVLYIKISVLVETNATLAAVTNQVDVEGGGAASATSAGSLTSSNSVNDEAPLFGPQTFSVQAYGPGGSSDTQAGDHPGMVSTTIDYTTINFAATHPGSSEAEVTVQEPKTITVNLPVGFIGDPLAAGTCPEASLRENGPGCPANSQVGTVILNEHGSLSDSESEGVSSKVYSMVPEPGYPMEFAFNVAKEGEIIMYPRLIPTASGYALSITVPAQPRSGLTPAGITLMLFGDPALRDAELHQRAAERETGLPVQLEQVSPFALFRNPTYCGSEPLSATVEMNSWVQPARWVTKTTTMYEATPTQGLDGCSALQFNPRVEVKPEVTETDTPSGYGVDIKVPQGPNFQPDLATSDLRGTEVTLPAGVAISPAAGYGLASCPATGPQGINITHGWASTGAQPLDPADPEAMEIAPDGLAHIAPGHCPSASRVGTVEITTPLLATPLTGHIYMAEPECGGEGQHACSPEDVTGGKLFRMYLEAEGSGIIIKLEGRIAADPDTGQLTVSFSEAPQFPFSDLHLQIKGGERALLANPQSCTAATATSALTPWATAAEGGTEAGANIATPSAFLQSTGCASPEPLSPGFLAQAGAPNAGGSTPLTMTVSRHDGEQDLFGFELKFPSGLLGLISAVTPCPEPQASLGTCSSESEIGHMTVALGSGSQPIWESGSVYLTGGYEGAPFGLSIVTPARVGPFNLGSVITRAAIHIDPHTAALTIDAAKLPQTVDGVPLRIKVINMTIDRPGFMINPTSCTPQQMSVAIIGALPDASRGASAAASTPFAVAGCRSLPFAPKITALAHAKTSKATGAYLKVTVGATAGQDNLGKVKVVLPKQLPSRLSTLQKACVEAVFEANPAQCPSGSVVGAGTAVTPLLKSPISGPAYMVSHGGRGFPDLEIVLQGEGVTITLDGSTQIAKGTTSTAFKALPDAPISSFQLVLPDGPNALLGANANLCKTKLAMPTAFTAQDGATIKQSTRIAVSGCPKSRPKGHKAKRANNS
jgi:hypothetical protein